ncbi:MAG: hypothetical protein CXZ00_01850 [Acidobacteria bacterium]|nr:MAG: hypothetical protein CXZ00_01850 [Acidobacteriota bacterium]
MISGLRDVRAQLLVVVAVLVLLDVAAIVLLLSPAGRSRGARQREYERLRTEKIEKTAEVTPAIGMDRKLATAREQIAQLKRERLAQHYSTMSEQISVLAAESGVGISNVRYDERTGEKNIPAGYESVGISIQVHGSYEQDMRFINAVERQKMMFLIDAVTFQGAKDGTLRVSVHLSTFLRSAA